MKLGTHQEHKLLKSKKTQAQIVEPTPFSLTYPVGL